MLMYITYTPLVFYLSSNPYLMTGFRFLVGYHFVEQLLGSVNGIALSQMSSLVSMFSVVWFFLFGLYVFLQFFHLIELCTFYNWFCLPFFHAATFTLIHISLLLHGNSGISYVMRNMIGFNQVNSGSNVPISKHFCWCSICDCMGCWSIRS